MNKREMSERLDVPYTTYNNYESGYREPGSDFLKKYSQIFGVSIDYILGNSAIKQKGDIIHEKNDAISDIILRLRTDSEFLDFVKDLNDLSDEQFNAVKTFLTAFKQQHID